MDLNSMDESLPLALTVPEVADILRVGEHIVYQLIRSGRLRALRIGSHKLRVPRQALLDYLGN